MQSAKNPVSKRSSASTQAAALAALATLALAAPPALADPAPSPARMWEIIQRQEREIDQLRRQLGETRAEVEQTSERIEEVGEAGVHLGGGIQLSGTIETAFATSESFAGVDGSDITLATVELVADAKVNDWVAVQATLLYEENATPLDVDGAVIVIGDTERFPVYLTTGLFAPPFGNFATNMLADPLTLEMAETKETAVQVGFDAEYGLHGSAWVFNGDTPRNGKGDFVNQYGFELGFSHQQGPLALEAGASWSNSLDDSDGVGEIAAVAAGVDDHTAGYGVYGGLSYGPLALIAEYVAAADAFANADLAFNGAGARPAAWNVEAAYHFDVAERPSLIAAGVQGTSEALALGLAEERYLVSASSEVFPNATLGLEYNYDRDYSLADGGTGANADALTLQLSVAF